MSEEIDETPYDELYDQAVDVVATTGKASTSFLQRQLGIGYARAAKIIKKMEDEKVVSAPSKIGVRTVLVTGSSEDIQHESKETPVDLAGHPLTVSIEEAEEFTFEAEAPFRGGDWEKIADIEKDLIRIERNDTGNARRLIKRFGEDLMFVPGGGWYGWTGTHWSIDDGPKLAQISAQETAKKIRDEGFAVLSAGNRKDETYKAFRKRVNGWYKFANSSGNSGKISAMMKEAEPHLQVKIDELDTHLLKITLLNGTLNLAAADNGKEDFDGITLEAHARNDRITRCAGVNFSRASDCPRWRKFIRDIQPDPEIQEFLQRWMGYCLTASNREQVLVMFYGGGANGKSTFMNIMAHVFDGYAAVLPFASLLRNDRKGGSDASPDLARLPGARLAMAAEPDVGVQFSESMLKQLTGGEKMTVRNLHEKFFEFLPQFKLNLSFNNKPAIRGQDEGIWRRILLVPFEQSFKDAHKAGPNDKIKDRMLEDKLKAEGAGILNWILDGYRMWAESGLCIPDQIRAATNEYRHESNPVHDFMQTWCVRGEGKKIEAGRLYKAYCLWCSLNAMDAWSQTKFGYKLNDMGIKKEKSGYVYCLEIDLNAEAEEEVFRSVQKRNARGGDD